MKPTRSDLLKHWMFMLFLLLVLGQTTGCGYVAAAGAGAAIGHEVAEEEAEDEEEEDKKKN